MTRFAAIACQVYNDNLSDLYTERKQKLTGLVTGSASRDPGSLLWLQDGRTSKGARTTGVAFDPFVPFVPLVLFAASCGPDLRSAGTGTIIYKTIYIFTRERPPRARGRHPPVLDGEG